MVIEYFLDWVQTAPVSKRVNAASALVRACTRCAVEQEEREEIEAALTVLLEDNAPAVRLAIAESFGAFASSPRHIMTVLAADSTEISVVVLSQSPVFHDAELVNFIKRGSRENQIAISCRPWLSPSVVSAICEFGCKDAALGLLMNAAAQFSQNDLHLLAQRHGASTDIRLILSDRKDLAAETRHVLIGKLGEALGNMVNEKAWLPKDRLDNVIGEAFDKASIIFAAKTRDEDIVCVVRNLIKQNRLTVSFLVHAICMGNIALVACAFSELSGIRFSRVENILTGGRESAFKALYARAELPGSAFIVFQTALTTWRRLLSSGSKFNQARLPFIVTREVLEAYAGSSDQLADELLVLLRKLSAETARESSKAKAMEISTRQTEENLSSLANEKPQDLPELPEVENDNANVIENISGRPETIHITADMIEAPVVKAA